MSTADLTLTRYRTAADGLAAALQDLAPTLTAEELEVSAEERGRRLDEAVDEYVDASGALFSEVVDDDPRRALATLGGDFRFLVELGQDDEGPALTAAEGTTAKGMTAPVAPLEDDLALVLGAVSGTPAEPQLTAGSGTGDPVAGAVDAIDAICARGRSALGAAVAAAVLPTGAELAGVVGRLLGDKAAGQFRDALEALHRWRDRIVRAATKLLQTVVAKIAALLGQAAADKAKEWLDELLDPAAVYEQALRVPELRDKARAELPTVADASARVARMRSAEQAHDDDQRWIGWGSHALSWAGPKVHAMQPWGPVVVGVVSVALVLVSAWLTEDYLDSYDVAWLPNRVPGVGAALA